MKHLKKILPMLLVTVLVCSAMASCRSDNRDNNIADTGTQANQATETPTTVASPAPTNEPAPPTDGPVTIRAMVTGFGKQKDSDEVWNAVNEKIKAFLPNLSVDFVMVNWDSYGQQWATAMAAQEHFDLAWMGWMLNLTSEVSMGSVQPITGYVAEYGKDITKFFSQTYLDAIAINGQLYNVPEWQGLVTGRTGYFFPKEIADLVSPTFAQDLQAINYDVWNKYDVESRKRVYEKFDEYLAAAAANDMLAGGAAPGNINSNIWNTIYPNIAWKAYVEYGDPTYTAHFVTNSDLAKLDYQYSAEWYQKGYIRRDIASFDGGNTWSQGTGWRDSFIFMAGNLYTDDSIERYSNTWGFEGVAAAIKPHLDYSIDRGGMVVPTTAKYPAEAVQFLNLLYSDNGADIWRTYMYGIEGKHWANNGDGSGTLFGGDNPQADWAYGIPFWTLGTATHSLNGVQGVSLDYFRELKALESTAYIGPLSGFAFDDTLVQTESAQISAVVGVYEPILQKGYMGAGWEDTFNEFNQKLKDAGLAAYMAEMQRQIDEYVRVNNVSW